MNRYLFVFLSDLVAYKLLRPPRLPCLVASIELAGTQDITTLEPDTGGQLLDVPGGILPDEYKTT